MVYLIWTSNTSLISVTSTYLPDWEHLRAAWPRRPPELASSPWRSWLPPDAALATVLNALAARYISTGMTVPAYARRSSKSIAIDTYIVKPGPAEGGDLDGWFESHTHSPDYRVVIHRQPLGDPQQPIPYLWRHAHRDPRLRLLHPAG